MSAITMLGSARRACSGPTRRETLKAGALSLLGGLFDTPSLRRSKTRRVDICTRRAQSVVLLYLQGGPPTQDMFDMKPEAPDGVGGEFQPIASSAPGIEVCELLPLTSQWMHHSAIVRSVYHNGGCHKNLPMYTGYDVNLPDEEFRDSDPPSMGSVCSYLERDQRQRVADVCVICPARWVGARSARRPGRTADFWAAATIRFAPSARPTSTIRPTTSGSRKSCAASRASPT